MHFRVIGVRQKRGPGHAEFRLEVGEAEGLGGENPVVMRHGARDRGAVGEEADVRPPQRRQRARPLCGLDRLRLDQQPLADEEQMRLQGRRAAHQRCVEIMGDERAQQLARAAQQRMAPIAPIISAVGHDCHGMAAASEGARQGVGIRALPEIANHQDPQRTVLGGGHVELFPGRRDGRGVPSAKPRDFPVKSARPARPSHEAPIARSGCQIARGSSTSNPPRQRPARENFARRVRPDYAAWVCGAVRGPAPIALIASPSSLKAARARASTAPTSDDGATSSIAAMSSAAAVARGSRQSAAWTTTKTNKPAPGPPGSPADRRRQRALARGGESSEVERSRCAAPASAPGSERDR